MENAERELLERIQRSVLKAHEAYKTVNDLILGVLETDDAPLVNHFLIKLQLAVNGICDTYFEGFDPEAKAMITEHVRSTMPRLKENRHEEEQSRDPKQPRKAEGAEG